MAARGTQHQRRGPCRGPSGRGDLDPPELAASQPAFPVLPGFLKLGSALEMHASRCCQAEHPCPEVCFSGFLSLGPQFNAPRSGFSRHPGRVLPTFSRGSLRFRLPRFGFGPVSAQTGV